MSSLAVIGDLMLDVVAHVAGKDVVDAVQAKDAYAQIRTVSGGTAYIAASAAIAAGFSPVLVLGTLGADKDGKPDPAASCIYSDLLSLGTTIRIRFVPSVPTGVVMITTFDDGRRLLVASPGANNEVTNSHLDADDVAAVVQCRLALFSGYCLLREQRAEMVATLMSACRSSGTLIALDLVPHRLETRTRSLEQCLTMADAVISEAATAIRVLGLDLNADSPADVETLALKMKDQHRFVLLRSSNDRELLFANGQANWLDTGHHAAAHGSWRGYLDRVAIGHLHAWLAHT